MVGAGVEGFDVGDRVMGTTLGAFAEFALADHRHVVAAPDALSWTDAAALPVGLTTEHDALVTQARFEAGQSVLVTGASSGVGLVGVQLAKALGASTVIATTTSASSWTRCCAPERITSSTRRSRAVGSSRRAHRRRRCGCDARPRRR